MHVSHVKNNLFKINNITFSVNKGDSIFWFYHTHRLSQLTRAAKVNDLDRAPFGVAEEDVLWLQVTVDYAEFRCSQEKQCCAQLLGKLAREVQRNTTEVGVTQQIIQIVGKHLKHQAQMVAEHELMF